jgi:GNAT superfamily N-acetyltransferase
MRLATTKEDVKSIMSIVRPYYKAGLMGIYPSIVYYSAVDKRLVWVDESAGVIEGFVMARIMKRSLALRVIQIAKIEGSSVRGSLLLSQAEQFARQAGLKAVILDAKKLNVKALEFYKRSGYVEQGEKDDCVVFHRRIL